VNVIIFFVILGALILLHELGHFVLAKRAGIKVEEFGLGFPPRLFAIRRGETEYSLNLIPLGGFVRMLGEEDPSAPRSFAAAPRGWRIAILAAGATMNIIVAVLLFTSAYAAGWPAVTESEVIITQILPNSPAALAGLQSGDVIQSLGGETIQRTDQLQSAIGRHLGQPTSIGIVRQNNQMTLQLTPRATWPPDQGPIGIAIEDHPLKVEPVYYSIPRAFVLGLTRTFQTLIITLTIPFLVLRGLVPLDVARPIGPLGIYQITSQAATQSVASGWWYPVLSVAGLISAGLGLANLLPIPGLDGGRLLFVILEAIRGRRISARRESLIHLVGLAFLVSVVLVVTYFDILSPVNVDFVPH
jgi:regulator of sigma E protease